MVTPTRSPSAADATAKTEKSHGQPPTDRSYTPAKGHLKTEKTLQKELETFAAEFEKQVLNGSYTDGDKMTFERYAEKYLDEYARKYQALKTLESTEGNVPPVYKSLRLYVS